MSQDKADLWELDSYTTLDKEGHSMSIFNIIFLTAGILLGLFIGTDLTDKRR